MTTTTEDPYSGHCRFCWAFKGRYGGECVDPECSCHGPACPPCVYGEPAPHTCAPDQAVRHTLLMREERES